MRFELLAVGFGILGSACVGSLETGGPGPGPGPGGGSGVQVLVTDGRAPHAGVHVIFEDPGDLVVADVMTDAGGLATADLPAGGSVSVIRTFPLPAPGNPPRPDAVTTYLGVKPGDRLALAGDATDALPTGAVNVLVPSLANGTVNVMASCGSGQGNPPVVPMSVTDCGAQVAIYAEDADRSALFMRAPYGPNVDVSAATFAPPLSSSITARDVPAGESVAVELRLGADGYYFYRTDPKQVDQAPANVDLPQVSGVDQLTITSVSGNNRTQVVTTRGAFATGTPIALDASSGLIGTISDPTFAPGTITWTEESPGAPDLVIASLDVTRSAPTNGASNEYVRTVIAPYAGPTLFVPALGGSGALYDATTDDQVATALAAVKVTGGYDALRASAFAGSSLVEATPAGGQLTISYGGAALPGL
jgi:hypothetical protein